ncbi:MAG: hypothetical protein ACI8P3_002899 [Saprospiraceae bacterium]|jgi:hypothetical protein
MSVQNRAFFSYFIKNKAFFNAFFILYIIKNEFIQIAF